jgi:hypothetical protein
MLTVYANALFGRWENAVYAAIPVKIPGSVAADRVYFLTPADDRDGENSRCEITEHPK